MPKRTANQRWGDQGESFVASLVDRHPSWLARHQDRDYGIDLEAELATSAGEEQIFTGKLVKIQCKAIHNTSTNPLFVTFSLDRDHLEYAAQFRIPVILVMTNPVQGVGWWLWLQKWTLENEIRLMAAPAQGSFTLSIPLEQTIASGLDGPLQAIARGEGPVAMTLALREIVTVASGWENRDVVENVIRALSSLHGPSRSWTLERTTDYLIDLSGRTHAEAQQALPALLALMDSAGDTFTTEQIVRLVIRGELVSRTGLHAVSRLFAAWHDHAMSLGLSSAFWAAACPQAAWYCAMLERVPTDAVTVLALSVANGKVSDLRYRNIVLTLDDETRDYIVAKWPNRGDSILVDCLHLVEDEES